MVGPRMVELKPGWWRLYWKRYGSEADEEARADECWPEEIQAHLEPSHHEGV